MDKKIVAEIDQKVIDQQNTLEKAGVPGFYITTNAQVNFLSTHCGGNACSTNNIVVHNTCNCDTNKVPAGGGVCPNKCSSTDISGVDNADEPA